MCASAAVALLWSLDERMDGALKLLFRFAGHWTVAMLHRRGRRSTSDTAVAAGRAWHSIERGVRERQKGCAWEQIGGQDNEMWLEPASWRMLRGLGRRRREEETICVRWECLPTAAQMACGS